MDTLFTSYKGFAFNNPVAVAREMRRKLDNQTKRHHMPKVDRTTLDPPPRVVAIVGPPKVKSCKGTLHQVDYFKGWQEYVDYVAC